LLEQKGAAWIGAFKSKILADCFSFFPVTNHLSLRTGYRESFQKSHLIFGEGKGRFFILLYLNGKLNFDKTENLRFYFSLSLSLSLSLAQQTKSDIGSLTVEVSRPHTIRHSRPVRLL
jgi:hypothetical protein